MVDVTPLIPSDRQVIDGYGAGGFRVSGLEYRSPILVFPDLTLRWDVADFSALTEASLQPILDHGGVEVLLLGCGPKMQLVPSALRMSLRRAGTVIDPMDTGAACRTYNVLLAEGRQIAAALLLAR